MLEIKTSLLFSIVDSILVLQARKGFTTSSSDFVEKNRIYQWKLVQRMFNKIPRYLIAKCALYELYKVFFPVYFRLANNTQIVSYYLYIFSFKLLKKRKKLKSLVCSLVLGLCHMSILAMVRARTIVRFVEASFLFKISIVFQVQSVFA